MTPFLGGHLAGLITGVVLSLAYKTPNIKKPTKYDWEKPDFNSEEDKFMQRFDENGILLICPLFEEEEVDIYRNSRYFTSNLAVEYEIKVNVKANQDQNLDSLL
jgi:hypothetical protein